MSDKKKPKTGEIEMTSVLNYNSGINLMLNENRLNTDVLWKMGQLKAWLEKHTNAFQFTIDKFRSTREEVVKDENGKDYKRIKLDKEFEVQEEAKTLSEKTVPLPEGGLPEFQKDEFIIEIEEEVDKIEETKDGKVHIKEKVKKKKNVAPVRFYTLLADLIVE